MSSTSTETTQNLVKLAYEMRFSEDSYLYCISTNQSCDSDTIGVHHYKFDNKKKVYGGLDYFECAIIAESEWTINQFEERYGPIKEDFKEKWKQARTILDDSVDLNYLAFFGKGERFAEVLKTSPSDINKMDEFEQYPISNAVRFSHEMAVFVHKLGGKIPFKSKVSSQSFLNPYTDKFIKVEKEQK